MVVGLMGWRGWGWGWRSWNLFQFTRSLARESEPMCWRPDTRQRRDWQSIEPRTIRDILSTKIIFILKLKVSANSAASGGM